MSLWIHGITNEDDVSREAVRDVWRKYYRLQATYDMKCTRMSKPGRAPIAPNLRPDPIEELEELKEFLQMVAKEFQSSQAPYLDDLRNFTAFPSEGLLDLATRFDNLAIPLLNAHLITERDLALVLCKHNPPFFLERRPLPRWRPRMRRDAFEERSHQRDKK